MNALRKISIILIAIFVFLGFQAQAFAETVITSPAVNVAACPAITHTLHIGLHDKTTEGQVTILQIFLHQKGYLSATPTGYFGSLTLKAVKAFQRESASGAVDGIVGVQTRAHIRAMDCQTSTVSAPTITSLSPSTGSPNTVVTIIGTGFTSTNNTVHLAIGGIGNLSSADGRTLQFTVPTAIGPYCKADQACPMYVMLLNNGSYPVYVENANGLSNNMSFTVTGSAGPGVPSAQ
ncbi:MAG TPA: peptidoglycan-binding protein [Candidatus Paceibacterota bacterium]|jgi:hypothetical protein|nr:peptidoglycan-binding protein [Candidatus Paceibacterota bacterium]